ncbi:O-methyltransferase [Schizopora paradoxa]|uniref:O-methyltransferase n=1 Tax=Schizopora paradoxa TaxID=27342 RepID=A0A0H2RMF0_9AGAM|nr:O-methyltransferase [Schizopora paradoxa]
MKSTLKALVEIISKNIDVLDDALEKRGCPVPSLDDPFTPGSDVANGQPELMVTADLACRAALQLAQIIRLPQLTLLQDSVSHLTSVSMRTAVELHIAEILNEAGPEGLHIDVIAEKCNVDSTKLGSILRCLAGRWIFKEVAPDVYANNRLSSLLDKGKSFGELKNSPENIYEKPQSGLSAAVVHFSDECLKSSAFFYEAMTDPKLAFSGEANHSGFSRAFNTEKSYWEFSEQPDQLARRRRFGVAMSGTQGMEPPGLPIVGYQWGSLPDGATVVDVGGGVGTVALQLAEAFPKLQFIVQDLPAVVEEGKKAKRFKESKKTAKVTFEAHDFFTPNPVKKPDVFLLKYITHDWSDMYVKKILSQLREAAGDKTRLVVMERIVPYTCPLPEGHVVAKVPGVIQPQFPPPVTIAFADNASFKASALMMTLTNGQERTLKHIVDLFASVGWKVESVVQFEGSGALPSNICAVPV